MMQIPTWPQRCLAATLFALFCSAACADVLLIETVEEAQRMRLPGNGQTMARVVQGWGEPQQRIAPVGEPPIARWIYDDYTVYFEHDRVIAAVVRHDRD
jgi:hypothetical protein